MKKVYKLRKEFVLSSEGVENTWLKGAGGIPKSFHTDNGKKFTTLKFTAHMTQQLYNKVVSENLKINTRFDIVALSFYSSYFVFNYLF